MARGAGGGTLTIAPEDNRLLVGQEVVQFMHAAPLGAGRWQLQGLLRGRGGTEDEARAGHALGARAVLIDDRLQLLDGTAFDPATERLAAIGLADAEPVFAEVQAPGRSRRPLTPVHPLARPEPGGGLALAWTRRARGTWAWRDGVETPLVEEAERYQIGAGTVDAPSFAWTTDTPALVLSAQELALLAPGTPLWVRQIGSHARSPALHLHIII